MDFQNLLMKHPELKDLFQKFTMEDIEKIQIARYPQDVAIIKREAQESKYAT